MDDRSTLALVGAGAVGLWLFARNAAASRQRATAAVVGAVVTEPDLVFTEAELEAVEFYNSPAVWLVDEGFVGHEVGAPRKSRSGGERKHLGLDVHAQAGTPVRAPRWGVVTDLSPDGQRQGYGNVVVLQHPEAGLYTFYAHLERWNPKLHVGSTVKPGDVLGYVGSTAITQSKPHLHFEVLLGQRLPKYKGSTVVNRQTPRMDPTEYLRQLGASAVR